MITQKLYRYRYESLEFRMPEEESMDSSLRNGFAFRLHLDTEKIVRERSVLLELPGTLCLSTRILNKTRDVLDGYEISEQYFLECGANGDVAVLEVSLWLDQPFDRDKREMRLGIPLTENDADIVLVYNKVRLYFTVNGICVNENFPVGIPHLEDDVTFFVDTAKLLECGLSYAVDKIVRETYERTMECGIQYYSPYGRNLWAGDVVNFWHDGVYHLLYLVDRHHHGNRWGGGAHYFAQLTTTDFVNWVDHGPLFELATPWHSVGTGTMFYHKGKYYLAFGFHSDRVIPWDKTYSQTLYREYEETGEMMPVSYEKIFAAEKYPSGTNYAVSDDGITFQLMNTMAHASENPSVYADEDGLTLIGGCGGCGIWKAKDVFSPWRLYKNDFPPEGSETPMNNTSECPSYFTWNGYKYIIMGLDGYWRTSKDNEEFFDSAALGYDVYDGLAVPMAVRTGDNRVIYAGWVNSIGWGSVIVQRELIQYPDGHLGMKWLPECAPKKDVLLRETTVAETIAVDAEKSYYYEIDIVPDATGTFMLQFDTECELKLDFSTEIAQFGEVGGENLPTARDIAKTYHDRNPWGMPGIHLQARNFAIEHVDVMKKPFTLRVIQRYSKKMNCVLIDAEIAGERTMLSCRHGVPIACVTPNVCGNTKISAVRMYAYEEEIL